jgi:uncharacterized protein YdeI (YjbR/CyaY-like superfamily)
MGDKIIVILADIVCDLNTRIKLKHTFLCFFHASKPSKLENTKMKPTFFATAQHFRKWLEKNHTTKTELIVGYYKVNSGKPSMNWSDSVDQALCFGWIDGVRRSIDEESYCIRFTPRNPKSVWSAVNIKKVEALKKQGLMLDVGLALYNKIQEGKTKIYGYETEEVKLSPEMEKQFKANKKAWSYFQALASSYRKQSLNWIMSAKQEATQLKRFQILLADCEAETNQWKDSKYKRK